MTVRGAGLAARATALGVLASLVLGAVLAPLPVRGAEAEPGTPPVVDLHVDLSYRVSFRHGSLARGSGQVVASRLLRAGVTGLVLPLFVPKDVAPGGPRVSDLETSRATLLDLLPRTPPYATPGCASEEGRVRTWLALEGSAPLAGDPEAPARWVSRGVRLFGLVHTSDNPLAGSSGSGVDAPGLSALGRDFVHAVHRAGAVVDVSHASDAATADAIRLAREDGVPLVATHSNARAVTDHPRNLGDDAIRGIADTGGVVGIAFHSRFLAARRAARLADVVRHVLHAVRVAGADHVAIGSDFEGDITPPPGLTDVRGFPRLARALAAAGLSHADVARVFSENALRILCPRGGGAATAAEKSSPPGGPVPAPMPLAVPAGTPP